MWVADEQEGEKRELVGIVSLLDVLQVLCTTYSSLLPSSSELDGQMN